MKVLCGPVDNKQYKCVCFGCRLIHQLLFLFFLGLMYVIETQKVLDLKVNLMASYVIIPQTGFYNGTQNILLLDLGHFKVREHKLDPWYT